MATNALNKSRKRVLVFNPLKRLIAIFQSCNAAAIAFDTSVVNIHDACSGKNISACNLYFRHLYEDKIELDMLEDLGTLQLKDYDKLIGLKRKYYPNKNMSRAGMSYKTKKKKS